MRDWLTKVPYGLSLLLVTALGAGCAGGQSGSEGLCPEGMVWRAVPGESMKDAFGTLASDEDGGVEMEPDADATLIANVPEGSDGPYQCIVPEE